MTVLLDPTGESQPVRRERLPRPSSLSEKTVGLLDISKPRGDLFLDHLAGQLDEMGATVQRYRKPTFTRVAPVDLTHQMVDECDVVIEALAD